MYRILRDRLGARTAQVLFSLWYAALILGVLYCYGQNGSEFYYLRH
jgi:hypothetical protein